MLYIFLQSIFSILYYFFVHTLLLGIIFSLLTPLEVVYEKKINLSYSTLNAHRKTFIADEKVVYTAYNKKHIIITHPLPFLQINNVLFWNHKIGVLELDYSVLQDRSLCKYPHIKSKIPLYNLNKYMLNKIHDIYDTLYHSFKQNPDITIINKNEITYSINNTTHTINIYNNKIIKCIGTKNHEVF
jgi:hypothetical protein